MKTALQNRIVAFTVPIAALSIFFLASAAQASITGDPATDNWTHIGLSTSAPQYDDGTGVFTANVYTTSFNLDASSPLLSTLGGFDWNVGDTVVGVGGVMTASSDLTYSGGADELGHTHPSATSLRIVIKYGSLTSTWTPNNPSSSSLPGYGSLAHGGVGSILLGNYPYDFYPTDSGNLIVPADSPLEQTSLSGTTGINGDVGRTITFWSGNTLVGFESFLDLTLLDTKYPSNGVQLGNQFDLDLQRGTGNFQDSIATLPASVPEPASAALIVIGVLGLLSRRRRLA